MAAHRTFLALAGDFPSVSEFFAHDPSRLPSFGERIELLKERRGLSESLHVTLLQFNRNLAAGAEGEANLSRLARGDAYGVVTVLRPSTRGGPDADLFRLATAVALCRFLEKEALGEFAPVLFFEEDPGNFASTGGAPESPLPEGPFRAEADDLLREGGNLPLPHATGRLLNRCFPQAGLTVMDHRFLRPEGLPLFEQELIDPGGVRSILRETGERLRKQGFEAPFEKSPPTNLFVEEEDAGPKHVRWEEERFTVEGEGEVEPFDLLCRIEDLHPGPVLRPLLRAIALPAAAEITGPVETARYANLRLLYPYFGLPAPLV
ncbi:MAG: bacillithiol biosynthesis protein BshC, partial [Planctomycetota bacterium]